MKRILWDVMGGGKKNSFWTSRWSGRRQTISIFYFRGRLSTQIIRQCLMVQKHREAQIAKAWFFKMSLSESKDGNEVEVIKISSIRHVGEKGSMDILSETTLIEIIYLHDLISRLKLFFLWGVGENKPFNAIVGMFFFCSFLLTVLKIRIKFWKIK